jgi:mono/diheme cytochrome c family protein
MSFIFAKCQQAAFIRKPCWLVMMRGFRSLRYPSGVSLLEPKQPRKVLTIMLKRWSGIATLLASFALFSLLLTVSAQDGAASGGAAGQEGGAQEAAAGDAAAGEALFTGTLGCYGCHGRAGGGGMGPSLADANWIYGGDVASITETLVNGRPGGMPAYGSQASEEEIADVVAYVISLSAK